MTLTVTELKENLRKTDEDAKSKDAKITSLEKDVTKVCTLKCALFTYVKQRKVLLVHKCLPRGNLRGLGWHTR